MKALSHEEKRRKLRELAADGGHASVVEMLKAYVTDSVASAPVPFRRQTMLFRNFYRCATRGCEWTDVWSAQCDDDCPFCGAPHMSPYKSEDAEEGDDE